MNSSPRLSQEYRQEITDLYARCARAFDEGRGDDFARLFTVDGTFSREGADPVNGHDGIAAFVRMVAERSPGTRHVVSGILVEPTEGGAKGTAYVLALVVGTGDLRLVTFGQYDDDFVHTSDGWRLRTRRFRSFVPPELANAVLAGVAS